MYPYFGAIKSERSSRLIVAQMATLSLEFAVIETLQTILITSKNKLDILLIWLV